MHELCALVVVGGGLHGEGYALVCVRMCCVLLSCGLSAFGPVVRDQCISASEKEKSRAYSIAPQTTANLRLV